MNRNKQRGSLLVGLIVVVLISTLVGGGFLYIQHKDNTIKKQAEVIATQQASILNQQKTIVTWEGKWGNRDILDEAKVIRANAARDKQIDNAVQAEKGKQKANASKIEETSLRDAEKYQGFTERVMGKNFKLLGCESDLRNMRDEKNCIGSIR